MYPGPLVGQLPPIFPPEYSLLGVTELAQAYFSNLCKMVWVSNCGTHDIVVSLSARSDGVSSKYTIPPQSKVVECTERNLWVRSAPETMTIYWQDREESFVVGPSDFVEVYSEAAIISRANVHVIGQSEQVLAGWLSTISSPLRPSAAHGQQRNIYSNTGRSERLHTQLDRAREVEDRSEALYSKGRVNDAARSVLKMTKVLMDCARTDESIANWLSEFTARCVSTLTKVGDDASNIQNHVEACEAYSMALSLSPSTPLAVLMKWAKIMLIRSTMDEVMSATAQFKISRFMIYKTICDVLEGESRIHGVIEYFRRMQSELRYTMPDAERTQWELEFRERLSKKLETLGDDAMTFENHNSAIGYYLDALSLSPANTCDILIKRSKAQVAIGSWDEALMDANKAIELTPLCHKGYKRKHDALHGMGRYGEAFEASELMLSKLQESPDPHTRELQHQYVDITRLIRGVIDETIRHIPRVLIDITTGRLCDKTQQAAAFEEHPLYNEMRSSMITRDQLDYSRIRKEVEKFYRYVMFSHRWQPDEPTFQMVENGSVYGLPASPTNEKLQRFCLLVRFLHFQWAWSDTCCVNQADKGVQQESVVAMFRWYKGSSLTIVHLLGVFSDSQESGCLWKSIWNTRGWTYQEYVASEVVRFYTEDWKPYLGLDMFNHKESSIILSEMECAMKFATQDLTTLRPGLDKVREKLYLASGRQTTREEDIAYSLFGIFDVVLPVIYGEGSQALRRFLEYILMRSGDVTLLAWTGVSGGHASYLPADLTGYNQINPPHIPAPIDMTELDEMVLALHSSLPDLSLTAKLYERLNNLPPLSLVAGRLRLPGIVFPITDLFLLSEPNSDVPVYRATTRMLDDVRIKTTHMLSGQGLLLIHPWISPLLDQDFSGGVPQFDLATRALRLVVRLRQSFGALLLAPLGRTQYTRVASESLIMVKVREEISLTELINAVDENINVQ